MTPSRIDAQVVVGKSVSEKDLNYIINTLYELTGICLKTIKKETATRVLILDDSPKVRTKSGDAFMKIFLESKTRLEIGNTGFNSNSMGEFRLGSPSQIGVQPFGAINSITINLKAIVRISGDRRESSGLSKDQLFIAVLFHEIGESFPTFFSSLNPPDDDISNKRKYPIYFSTPKHPLDQNAGQGIRMISPRAKSPFAQRVSLYQMYLYGGPAAGTMQGGGGWHLVGLGVENIILSELGWPCRGFEEEFFILEKDYFETLSEK